MDTTNDNPIFFFFEVIFDMFDIDKKIAFDSIIVYQSQREIGPTLSSTLFCSNFNSENLYVIKNTERCKTQTHVTCVLVYDSNGET